MWKDYLPSKRRLRRYRSTSMTKAQLIAKLTKIAFVLVIIGVVGFLISFPLIARDLPSPDKVVRRTGFSTKILDRNGVVLYDVYNDQNRIEVNINDIPSYLREGTIAT